MAFTSKINKLDIEHALTTERENLFDCDYCGTQHYCDGSGCTHYALFVLARSYEKMKKKLDRIGKEKK